MYISGRRGFRHFFRDLSTNKKFLIVLIVFMIIPLLVISTYLYVHLRDNMLSDEYDRQSQNLNLMNRVVDLQLKEYERVIQSVYTYQDMFPLITKSPQEAKTLDYQKVSTNLRNVYSGIDYVESAYIFGVNDAVFFHNSSSGSYYEKIYGSNPQWAENILTQTGSLTWIPSFKLEIRNTSSQPKNIFSCGMRIHDVVNTLDFLGICIINIDTALFDNTFRDIQQDSSTLLFITDSNGHIVWSSYSDVIATTLPQELFAPLVETPSSFIEHAYLDTDYVITSKRSRHNDWYYISMTPRQHVLRASQWTNTFVFTQVAVILFFLTIGALLIRHYVTSPLQRITVIMGMDKDEREKMLRRIPDDRGDEIGRLYHSFHQLETRLTRLISDIQTAHANENEYRVKALQAQINPHFIYNTLDTIRWMAKDAGAEHVCELILSLSGILRYSISKKSDIVTVEEELECLYNYINIYLERYENMFTVEVDVDEDVLHFKTFRMLLQPLVENVMTHAFKSRTEGGLLRIEGRLIDGNARIAVIDNGVGMSRDRILTVLSQESKSIGLSNINQRLMLIYGRGYPLHIDSTVGLGTTVYIDIPPRFEHPITGKDG